MKHNDIPNVSLKLTSQNLENIFDVYVDEDVGYYYNLLTTVYFPNPLDPDTYDVYYVEPKDSWPLISWKFYNSVKLWWVICSANNIDDPTALPTPGSRLRIIKPNLIKDLLNKLK